MIASIWCISAKAWRGSRNIPPKEKRSFLADRKGQDAVLRNLHTLTESAMRLSHDVKATCQEVDWRGIASFRNVVVHNYLGLDLDQIWLIVERDLPPLKKCVLEALRKLPPE